MVHWRCVGKLLRKIRLKVLIQDSILKNIDTFKDTFAITCSFVYVGHDYSSPGIESKGHNVTVSEYGRGNAVGLTSILDLGQFFKFSFPSAE